MSRELPILFNTDMVRAILDERKTVTRRLVKHDVDNENVFIRDADNVLDYWTGAGPVRWERRY